ncbi:MAG: hypothetical protein V1708_00930 [Candidatus Micrarchaeota archaeon]
MEELARILRKGGWSSAHGFERGYHTRREKGGNTDGEARKYFFRLVLVPREELRKEGKILIRADAIRLIQASMGGIRVRIERAKSGRKDGIVVTDYEALEESPARQLSYALTRLLRKDE